MPESTGKGSGEGEDLFEDLDKFFAPIQDVDWPESSGPSAAAPAAPGTPDPITVLPEDTASFEPEVLASSRSDEPSRHDPGSPSAAPAADEEPSSGMTPGQEDLFGIESEAMTGRPTAASDADDDEDVGDSDLFGEDDLADDDAITEEAFAQSPTAYIELPTGDDDPAVAELVEDAPAHDEPAPDLETVEAAADHFAESVRDDVNVEPASTSTEEVAISSLLRDEDDDEDLEPEPSRTVRVGPEGLGGPSWQEPTTLEVGAEPERRRAGRDVPMAFLTGLILAAAAVGAIALGAGPFAVLAGAVVLFAQGEFYLALQKRHYQPATALGLVSGALVLAAGYYRGEQAMIAMVALGTVAAFLWYMTVPVQHRRNVVSNIALTVLGIVYIPMLAAYALAVLKYQDGRALALSIIGLTIVYDIGAFVVGTWWGSRPLAPNVSPKKSWEGAIGGTLVAVAIAVGIVTSVEPLNSIPRAAGLALVVAIFAPLGDLAESIVKRDLGLKDMGSVLPGHGGVLDRIDAVLFVAPAAFLYLRLILG